MSKRKFGYKPIETFIEFRELGTSPSGKTKIWDVVNTNNGSEDSCGFVRWHGPWRKYVFQSPDDSFFDWDFLRYVGDFIEQQTLQHRANKR